VNNHTILVVCGPTASGKTALAVTLAQRYNGEIISADSRQVYRGLDIGSGKDLHEYRAAAKVIPHHLIDIISPEETYTVSHYQKGFYRIFKQIRSRGACALLCGGSGLYIEAVLRGYRIPEVPENSALRSQLSTEPVEQLIKQLETLDPQRLKQTDTSSKKRIIRAIEIASAPPSLCPDDTGKALSGLSPVILCTRWDRTDLHRRITERLYRRFDEGMIGEVFRLRRGGLSDERLLMMGMEYRHITRYLRGELQLQTMIETLQHEIFRLAKRQESYFRGMERRSSIPVHWIDNADTATAIAVADEFFSR